MQHPLVWKPFQVEDADGKRRGWKCDFTQVWNRKELLISRWLEWLIIMFLAWLRGILDFFESTNA